MGKRLSRRASWLKTRLLVFVLPFILLAPVWLTGRALYWGTPSTQFIPWLWQAWSTFRTGEWPLWNPLLGMGAPLLANYQSAIFYPPNWIYFLLAAVGGLPLMAWGQAILVSAHLAFAGWGMLKLIQKLGLGELAQIIGALAFSLCGYLVARAHFLSINSTVAWLPWVLLATYDLTGKKPARRSMLALAFFLAMQWLAGHAQISAYTLMLAIAWLLFWTRLRNTNWSRPFMSFLTAVFLALALSAVQLLPTAEYLLLSQRAAQYDPAAAMTYSFWPWRFLGLLSPNIFGNPANGQYLGYGNFWEDAVYIGLLPLLLIVGALGVKQNQRLKRFLFAIALVAFLLALGNNLPLFPWLYAHVPSFDLFQAPTRFSIWAVFSLSLLAALAADTWQKPSGSQVYWLRLAVAAAIATILASTAFAVFVAARPMSYNNALGLLRFGVFALAIAVLTLKAPRKIQTSSRWTWLVLAVLSLDLLTAGWGLNSGGPLSFYKDSSTNQQTTQRIFISAEDERRLKFDHFFRFDTFSSDPIALRASLLPNISLLDGVSSASNFDPLQPARYADWMAVLEDQPPGNQAAMLAAMSVGQLETISGQGGAVTFAPVAHLDQARWVGCAIPVSDSGAALDLVRTGSVDFEQSVVVESFGLVPDACAYGNGNVQILRETANAISISVDADTPGWFVLADTWFLGWTAEVNGEESKIYPAYGIFRAVKLDAGISTIDFSYQPLSFFVGLAVSSLAWPTFAILRKKFHLD